jgi:hypothetical protein
VKRIKRTAGKKPMLVIPRPKKQRPDWLTDAPTTAYVLLAQQFDGEEVEIVQEIDLSLEHYESLRRHLASLQGWPINQSTGKAV